MSTSKLQRRCSAKLSFDFAKYTIRENSRPEWCLGDNLERLELDFYIPEINVAIEVQGAQHYEFSPHFHENYEAFKSQQQRDAAKKRRCDDYAITLIEIYDELSFDEAIEAVRGIAKAFEFRARKPMSPEEWKRVLTGFHKNIADTWRHRATIDVLLLSSRFSNQKHKLLNLTGVYGMTIFQNIDAEVAQEIFSNLQSLDGCLVNMKRKRQGYRSTIIASASNDGEVRE